MNEQIINKPKKLRILRTFAIIVSSSGDSNYINLNLPDLNYHAIEIIQYGVHRATANLPYTITCNLFPGFNLYCHAGTADSSLLNPNNMIFDIGNNSGGNAYQVSCRTTTTGVLLDDGVIWISLLFHY
jgi:hypothetical protein